MLLKRKSVTPRKPRGCLHMILRGREGEQGESSDSRREHVGVMGRKILEKKEGNVLLKLHIRGQELELIGLCIPEHCLR